MIEEKYRIRNYSYGDDEAIAKLFNETYKDYAGFVPRTASYWRWCCFDRPDVEKNNIVILEDKRSKEIVAYVVLGKSGNIWELCVKPVVEKRKIVTMLLEKALEHAERNNVEMLMVNVPFEDKITREVCEELGFGDFSVTSMQIGALDFGQLLKALTERSIEHLKDFNETMLFFFIEKPPWITEKFILKISGKEIRIISKGDVEYNVKIITKPRPLMTVLFGLRNPLEAIILRKLKIEPWWKALKIAKFLSVIAVKDPWYYPRADFG